jgi:hypothetical protein
MRSMGRQFEISIACKLCSHCVKRYWGRNPAQSGLSLRPWSMRSQGNRMEANRRRFQGLAVIYGSKGRVRPRRSNNANSNKLKFGGVRFQAVRFLQNFQQIAEEIHTVRDRCLFWARKARAARNTCRHQNPHFFHKIPIVASVFCHTQSRTNWT